MRTEKELLSNYFFIFFLQYFKSCMLRLHLTKKKTTKEHKPQDKPVKYIHSSSIFEQINKVVSYAELDNTEDDA